jgi:protein transport protein SEC24
MSSGLCRAVYAFDDLAGLDKLQLSGDALKSARDVLQRTCVEALYEYRVACASRSPPGQLILPESIKLLPLLVLGAFKGLLLRSASPQQPGADACERAATLELAMGAPSAWLCRCAAPRGYLLPPSEGGLNPIPASASSCAPLSLLDCASHLYVHVASGAPPDSRQALRLACGVQTSGDRLPRIDVGLHALWAQMSRDAPRPPPLLLLDEPALDGRATLDDETRRARRRLAARADLLIEDPSAHGPPYVDFLCAVHRQIQQKMAADRQG